MGSYVASPLRWGIHASPLLAPSASALDERSTEFAISRKGSGSHLMAFVLARSLGWDTSRLRFVEVGNLEGARRELARNARAVFLWEKAMTQPLVARGEMRRVGEIPTPWPCFVLAATKAVAETRARELGELLDALARAAREFKSTPAASVDAVVREFNIERGAAQDWFDHVEFACVRGVDEAVVRRVRETLVSVGQLKPELVPAPGSGSGSAASRSGTGGSKL